MTSTEPRVIRAPRGAELTCKGWPQEAALRMLMNNLDPEVAERPEDLVVYGGTGKAARDWESFEAMVEHIEADRLMWGTDMPFQNRFCTYRQSREFIERYAPGFLSPDQIAAIMGGTAARFLDLPVGER